MKMKRKMKRKRKLIRDPLHGYIGLDELAVDIVDTAEMQRLRRIRQLGFSYLVYPGANHTRFEHSLGTYHLVCLLIERLGLKKDEERELIVASLIHDVGHGPYSHVTNSVMKENTGKSHEDIDDIVFGREQPPKEGSTIVDVLEKHSIDKKDVVNYIKGKGDGISQILNGEVDADKMDYLVRDSYYTGVAYGLIDNTRLIQGLDFHDGKLVITQKGILPASHLLFARFLMYPTVYYHHTSRIAQLMFLKALEAFIEDSDERKAEVSRLMRMDDYEINVVMRNASGYTSEIMNMINNRKLFKRAVYRNIKQLDEGVLEELNDEKKKKEIEKEIAGRAGIDEKYLILDPQKHEEIRERKAKVLMYGEIKTLDEVSEVVNILEKAFLESYNVGIYTPERYRDAVSKSAEEILFR